MSGRLHQHRELEIAHVYTGENLFALTHDNPNYVFSSSFSDVFKSNKSVAQKDDDGG